MPKFTWKTILLIIGFIILVAIIGFAIYYLFFRVTITPPAEEISEEQLTQLPIPEKGEIVTGEPEISVTPETKEAPTKIITRAPVSPETPINEVASGGVTVVTDLDYTVTTSISRDASGQNIITYNPDSGQFSSLTRTGQKQLLTQKTFPNVETITWAKKSQKAILEFPDGSNILYDFENDRQITLPTTWTEFEFNSDENQIAFKDMDINPEKRFLAIASPDGSNQKYVEYLGTAADDVSVLWSPNNQVIATINKGGSSNFTEIQFIGQNNENFKSLEVNGQGVQMQYTPDSQRLIYSAHNSYTDNKPVLYIVDAAGDSIGQNHNNLNLHTWADKCTFADSSTVYCSVPKEMPQGAGWFPELAEEFGDYIYKIDLTTGSTSFLAEPEYEYSIEQMTISEDGTTLYFTDTTTQTVHKIKIK